jgi:tetratricopeptide (TPR) repeat protein
MRAGTPEKAVVALTRVVTQNPGSVQARLLLAQAHAVTKDLPAAIEALEIIVDEEPRVAAALGQYQEQAGLLREAAATYTKALAVQPTSRELKSRRIAALYGARDFTAAASFAGDAKRQHPEDARFPRLEARALFDAGDKVGGVSVLEAAAKTFPRDTPTLYALADIYRDAGRATDAEQALRRVLVIEPANPNALNYLGYLLAMRGDKLDEAVQLVRKALEAEPDNGAYLDSLGWALFKRGDLAEAQKYLDAAANRMPRNSEVQDHLGDVFARQGRLDDAIAAWTRALEGDASDVNLDEIRRKIDDARSKSKR